MNKRERLLDLVNSRARASYIPAAFFLHFAPEFRRGEAAIRKHLEFFRHTDMDFVKIQYEETYPRNSAIERASDWRNVRRVGADHFEPAVDVVRGIARDASEQAAVVLTLYSPFMLAGYAAGGQDKLVAQIEDDPEAVRAGMRAVTDDVLSFMERCVEAGVDGFYTSTQGGELGRFSDPSLFDACVRPFDLEVMREAERSGRINILHVCDFQKPYDSIEKYTSYPGHIVNSSLEISSRTMSPAEVADLFARPFMGGLDRLGILSKGTADEVRIAAERACAAAPDRFILGADCTVPAETNWDNLRAAIDVAHRFRG